MKLTTNNVIKLLYVVAVGILALQVIGAFSAFISASGADYGHVQGRRIGMALWSALGVLVHAIHYPAILIALAEIIKLLDKNNKTV